METQNIDFTYRLLTEDDIGHVPLQHQGSPAEVLERVKTCGSSAMLAFEENTHVGQLQFRPYIPDTVSPNGLYDPLYWMDFQGHAPPLPDKTLALFCYHVGQLHDTDERDPRYFGRGIGTQLLDRTLSWVAASGFNAILAKGLTSHPPLIQFMGGMPEAVYRSRGFISAATYHDGDLRSCLDDMIKGTHGSDWEKAFRTLLDNGVNLDKASEISVCVLTIP